MKRPAQGFSASELLVVVAVSAILLSIAVPEMRTLIRRQQLKSAVGDLFGAVELTRSLAMARGGRVMLAPRDGAGADWTRGWAIFADRDGDGRPGKGDEIIALQGALPPGIAISTAFSSKHNPDYLAYNSAGRGCSGSSSQAARWGTISLSQDGRVRRIRINMLGRARICDPAVDGAACAGD